MQIFLPMVQAKLIQKASPKRRYYGNQETTFSKNNCPDGRKAAVYTSNCRTTAGR